MPFKIKIWINIYHVIVFLLILKSVQNRFLNKCFSYNQYYHMNSCLYQNMCEGLLEQDTRGH